MKINTDPIARLQFDQCGNCLNWYCSVDKPIERQSASICVETGGARLTGSFYRESRCWTESRAFKVVAVNLSGNNGTKTLPEADGLFSVGDQ